LADVARNFVIIGALQRWGLQVVSVAVKPARGEGNTICDT
jgi:hypothetical protein